MSRALFCVLALSGLCPLSAAHAISLGMWEEELHAGRLLDAASGDGPLGSGEAEVSSGLGSGEFFSYDEVEVSSGSSESSPPAPLNPSPAAAPAPPGGPSPIAPSEGSPPWAPSPPPSMSPSPTPPPLPSLPSPPAPPSPLAPGEAYGFTVQWRLVLEVAAQDFDKAAFETTLLVRLVEDGNKVSSVTATVSAGSIVLDVLIVSKEPETEAESSAVLETISTYASDPANATAWLGFQISDVDDPLSVYTVIPAPPSPPPPPSEAAAPPPDASPSDGPPWAIIGGAIGGGVLLCCLLAGLALFMKRRRKKRKNAGVDAVDGPSPPAEERTKSKRCRCLKLPKFKAFRGGKKAKNKVGVAPAGEASEAEDCAPSATSVLSTFTFVEGASINSGADVGHANADPIACTLSEAAQRALSDPSIKGFTLKSADNAKARQDPHAKVDVWFKSKGDKPEDIDQPAPFCFYTKPGIVPGWPRLSEFTFVEGASICEGDYVGHTNADPIACTLTEAAQRALSDPSIKGFTLEGADNAKARQDPHAKVDVWFKSKGDKPDDISHPSSFCFYTKPGIVPGWQAAAAASAGTYEKYDADGKGLNQKQFGRYLNDTQQPPAPAPASAPAGGYSAQMGGYPPSQPAPLPPAGPSFATAGLAPLQPRGPLPPVQQPAAVLAPIQAARPAPLLTPAAQSQPLGAAGLAPLPVPARLAPVGVSGGGRFGVSSDGSVGVSQTREAARPD